jgi:hypothetical protein
LPLYFFDPKRQQEFHGLYACIFIFSALVHIFFVTKFKLHSNIKIE